MFRSTAIAKLGLLKNIIPVFLHTCVMWSELPSNISTVEEPNRYKPNTFTESFREDTLIYYQHTEWVRSERVFSELI